jgi:hypothetical protein
MKIELIVGHRQRTGELLLQLKAKKANVTDWFTKSD